MMSRFSSAFAAHRGVVRKVRGCERPGEVLGWVDVAIRDFLVGGRSGGGLGARLTNF